MILLLNDIKLDLKVDTVKNKTSKSFTYKQYYLYFKDIKLKGSNKKQRIYFFSKKQKTSGIPCSLPKGYQILENKRTRLPFLKKEK